MALRFKRHLSRVESSWIFRCQANKRLWQSKNEDTRINAKIYRKHFLWPFHSFRCASHPHTNESWIVLRLPLRILCINGKCTRCSRCAKRCCTIREICMTNEKWLPKQIAQYGYTGITDWQQAVYRNKKTKKERERAETMKWAHFCALL